MHSSNLSDRQSASLAEWPAPPMPQAEAAESLDEFQSVSPRADCRVSQTIRIGFLEIGFSRAIKLLSPARSQQQRLPESSMFEFIPLILFFAAFVWKDFFFALVVLMIAAPAGLLAKYLVKKKLDKMYM